MKHLAPVAIIALTLVGCASTKAPTAIETKLFNVETNIVEVVQTNTVFKTNYVVQNIQNIVPTPSGSITNYTLITNAVAVPIQVPVTNYVESYAFKPNETAATVTATGGMIGNFFGAGGLVTTIIGGLFASWASWRSRKNGQTAVALAQIIETGREVLKSVPNGAAIDSEYVNFMTTHQAEAGVLQNVMNILAKVTDNSSAQQAAREISATIEAVKASVTPKV
ncbi:MAG: hypothetical protein ACOYD4_03995 [Solirubrobacterales bacterium]